MSNAIVTQPIAKLYKRCARKHHTKCEGSFQDYSVCSCSCHEGSVMVPTLTEADALAAAETADAWIAQHAVKAVSPTVTRTATRPVSAPKALRPKSGPRNIAGGLKCVLTEGFKSVRFQKFEHVKVTLKPEHRFPESKLITDPEELAKLAARDRIWRETNHK